MTFHAQSFEARLGAMGDTAEGVFDIIYPKHHKLGLNRPPFNVAGMGAMLRYTPDRALRDRLVEVMGLGKDRVLKLKHEKLDALIAWTMVAPVDLFVYDQTEHDYYEAPIAMWASRAHLFGEEGEFHEGKTYLGLTVDHFPSTPTPAPEVPLGPS